MLGWVLVPKVFLGFSKVFLGFSKVFPGFPKVFLGFPKIFLGFSKVFLGLELVGKQKTTEKRQHIVKTTPRQHLYFFMLQGF